MAIEQRLLERGHSLIRLTQDSTSAYRQPEIRYYKRLSIEGMWSFARGGVLLLLMPSLGEYRKSRDSATFSCGTVGRQAVGLLHNDRAIAADLAPVCSEIGRRYRCSEFRLSANRVPIIGAPRNDPACSWRTGEPSGTAWGGVLKLPFGFGFPPTADPSPGAAAATPSAPTGGFGSTMPRWRYWMSNSLTTTSHSVLKPHPMTSIDNIAARHGLRLISQAQIECSGPSLYEVLAAADGLVTDASSVWIDYLLTQRPIIFAFPDIEEYRQRRG